jgi:hypothetical protein
MTVVINGTSGLSGTNGSAGTPAVQGEDTNTGIFFPAADTVGVATGGSERLRVNSAGDVGIGTSSPSSYNSSARQLVLSNASTSTGMTIRAGGGGAANIIFSNAEDTAVDGLIQYDTGSNYFRFDTNGLERLRIDSGGAVRIGATSSIINEGVFGVNGSGNVMTVKTTDGGANSMLVWNAGTSGTRNLIGFLTNTTYTSVGTISTNGSSTTYATSSDYRLKENVQPMQNALDTVAQLNPVTYTWKADGSAGQGFIAHELQAVVPDCVSGEKDAVDAEGNPQYQGVDTSFLVATLVKAVQELTARIAALEAAQ